MQVTRETKTVEDSIFNQVAILEMGKVMKKANASRSAGSRTLLDLISK